MENGNKFEIDQFESFLITKVNKSIYQSSEVYTYLSGEGLINFPATNPSKLRKDIENNVYVRIHERQEGLSIDDMREEKWIDKFLSKLDDNPLFMSSHVKDTNDLPIPVFMHAVQGNEVMSIELSFSKQRFNELINQINNTLAFENLVLQVRFFRAETTSDQKPKIKDLALNEWYKDDHKFMGILESFQLTVGPDISVNNYETNKREQKIEKLLKDISKLKVIGYILVAILIVISVVLLK